MNKKSLKDWILMKIISRFGEKKLMRSLSSDYKSPKKPI